MWHIIKQNWGRNYTTTITYQKLTHETGVGASILWYTWECNNQNLWKMVQLWPLPQLPSMSSNPFLCRQHHLMISTAPQTPMRRRQSKTIRAVAQSEIIANPWMWTITLVHPVKTHLYDLYYIIIVLWQSEKKVWFVISSGYVQKQHFAIFSCSD